MTSEIRLLLFDVDGTLIRNPQSNFNSSWDAVGMAAGLVTEFEKNKQKYVSHPDQWNQWAETDASLLRGRNFEEIRRKTFEIISYAPGLEEYFQSFGKRCPCGILSNGVGFVADEIASRFGFNSELCLADRLLVKNGLFTGEIVAGMLERKKINGLDQICKQLGINDSQIGYVGDHLNDVGIFERVGIPIFMDNGNPDPDLEIARTAAKGNIITNMKEINKYVKFR